MSNFSQLVQVLIRDEMQGKPRHEYVLELGDTPHLLRKHAQFPDMALAVQASVISKACFEHGIATGVLKRLPEILQTPKGLYKSATVGDAAVVFTFERHRRAPIVIPVHKNKQVGRGRYYNLIASIYGKEGPDPERRWIQEGLLLWCEGGT